MLSNGEWWHIMPGSHPSYYPPAAGPLMKTLLGSYRDKITEILSKQVYTCTMVSINVITLY